MGEERRERRERRERDGAEALNFKSNSDLEVFFFFF